MLYPQLPPPPLVISGSNDDSVNVMEIIIGGDGSVERVKLVSPPRRLTDMMLLSGAKSWKFTPASKNGLPVRYRMAFSLGHYAVEFQVPAEAGHDARFRFSARVQVRPRGR